LALRLSYKKKKGSSSARVSVVLLLFLRALVLVDLLKNELAIEVVDGVAASSAPPVISPIYVHPRANKPRFIARQ
jgi:hypothetical protein